MSPCVLEFLLFLIEFLLMCVYIYVCMYVCMYGSCLEPFFGTTLYAIWGWDAYVLNLFFLSSFFNGDLNHTNFLMGPWEILFEWYYFITKLYTHPWDLNPQPHLHLFDWYPNDTSFLFSSGKLKRHLRNLSFMIVLQLLFFIFQILYLVLYYDAYDELLGFPFKT